MRSNIPNLRLFLFLTIFFFSASTLFVPISVYGQKPNGCEFKVEPAWERFELKGRVKKVVTHKIDHDPRWGKPYVGPRELFEEISFTPDGEIAQYKDWIPRVKAQSNGFRLTPICDSHKRVTSVISNDGGKPFEYQVLRYDEGGQVVERSTFLSTGVLESKETTQYDANGRPSVVTTTIQVHPEHFTPRREDVYITTKVEFEHDAKGNRTVERHYRANGELYAKWESTYDRSNRLLKYRRIDKEGRAVDMQIYTYKDGHLIEKVDYQNFCIDSKKGGYCEGPVKMPEGDFYYATREVFENDRRGNWVRKVASTKGGEEERLEYRLSAVYDRVILYH